MVVGGELTIDAAKMWVEVGLSDQDWTIGNPPLRRADLPWPRCPGEVDQPGDLAATASSGMDELGLPGDAFDAAISAVTLAVAWRDKTISAVTVASVVTVTALPLKVELSLPQLSIRGWRDAADDPVKVRDVVAAAGLSADDVPEAPVVSSMPISGPTGGQKLRADARPGRISGRSVRSRSSGSSWLCRVPAPPGLAARPVRAGPSPADGRSRTISRWR